MTSAIIIIFPNVDIAYMCGLLFTTMKSILILIIMIVHVDFRNNDIVMLETPM